MGLFKCCVGGCNATSESHRLFSFPKNDSLRNLWMSFLVPTNSLLIGLTKEQLLRKRVCEKHFDKHQFDEEGKRLRHSYPCLFTDDEIAHGVPLSSDGSVQNALSDHNYYKDNADEDEGVADDLLVIGKTGENFHEHPSCSNYEVVQSVTEKQRDMSLVQTSCSYSQEIEFSALVEHTEIRATPTVEEETTQNDQKCLIQKCEDTLMKKISSKKRKFVNHVTKVASGSLGQTAAQRLEQAAAYGNNEQLFKKFCCLTKQAQTFLLMQLKQCRKNKMARRFTLDEKLTALVLMKQSPN